MDAEKGRYVEEYFNPIELLVNLKVTALCAAKWTLGSTRD